MDVFILILIFALLVLALIVLLALANLVKRCCSEPSTDGSELDSIKVDDRDIDAKILKWQENLRRLGKDVSSQKEKNAVKKHNEEIYSEVEKLLLDCTVKERLISESEDCRLIIGVDATPMIQAGYCVNLKEKWLSYYVIKCDDFPWVLHDPKVSSEFEMKNFMFALTVWEDEILKAKRIRIYTDNFAITKDKGFDDKYGERAFKVLRHYTNCESITVSNTHDIAINRFENLKDFVKYIKPADDLSRWKINQAEGFLMRFYGIEKENVQGTHYQDNSRLNPNPPRNTQIRKAWYNPTERYEDVLRDVQTKINASKCSHCPRKDLLQESLKRSNKSSSSASEYDRYNFIVKLDKG